MKLKCISLAYAVIGLRVICFPVGGASSDEAVQILIERILPRHTNDFIIETVAASAGENVFELDSQNGKVVLCGDGPLSPVVAFNWYLRGATLVSIPARLH